ncbi:MAG: cation diffusion facilitator family transporter [Methanocalculus sp.]|uniref:cation diffusion facilitator family transporter n=1 Tax=Methanocalculus sp. TaxID=2004547 RepID=UPI0027264D5B|nr:cation diffusion facilitator family transporter [Methanocalculus sp.]MDO9539260.1 cation diffusion facilitator family transporter [Methanocalculus sp.]
MTAAIESLLSEEKAIHTAEKEREHALFLNLLVATAPAIPKLIAATLSGSVTLLTSGMKTINEAMAILVAWIISRKIAEGNNGKYDYGMGKFENLARIVTGGLILVSLLLLVLAAIFRILFPAKIGSEWALVGMVIVVIMAAVDSYFWIKNYRIAKRDPSPIMDSQCHLFRLKAIANLVVLVTLVIAVLCAGNWWSVYIDPVGSFIVMGFLLYSGYTMIISSLPDLLDQTIEEELQLIVMKELAGHFHNYEQIHEVKSRQSGGSIYIDIFLEFGSDQLMGDVQDIMDQMKLSLETRIPKSSVNIITSRGRNKRCRL